MMPNLAARTHVADGSCGGCGKTVHIILNKNGNAYYFCSWSNDHGQPCSHHERWGKAHSQKFQNDYLKARAANVTSAPKTADSADETAPAIAANDNRAPETATDPGKSAGGSLYDQLTRAGG